jgi:hypothetical protein
MPQPSRSLHDERRRHRRELAQQLADLIDLQEWERSVGSIIRKGLGSASSCVDTLCCIRLRPTATSEHCLAIVLGRRRSRVLRRCSGAWCQLTVRRIEAIFLFQRAVASRLRRFRRVATSGLRAGALVVIVGSCSVVLSSRWFVNVPLPTRAVCLVFSARLRSIACTATDERPLVARRLFSCSVY